MFSAAVNVAKGAVSGVASGASEIGSAVESGLSEIGSGAESLGRDIKRNENRYAGAALAGAALLTGNPMLAAYIAGTAEQRHQERGARREERRAQRAATRARQLQSNRARSAQAAGTQRMEAAQANVAAQTGAAGSSAIQASAFQTQLASNLSFMSRTETLGQQATRAQQRAANRRARGQFYSNLGSTALMFSSQTDNIWAE